MLMAVYYFSEHAHATGSGTFYWYPGCVCPSRIGICDECHTVHHELDLVVKGHRMLCRNEEMCKEAIHSNGRRNEGGCSRSVRARRKPNARTTLPPIVRRQNAGELVKAGSTGADIDGNASASAELAEDLLDAEPAKEGDVDGSAPASVELSEDVLDAVLAKEGDVDGSTPASVELAEDLLDAEPAMEGDVDGSAPASVGDSNSVAQGASRSTDGDGKRKKAAQKRASASACATTSGNVVQVASQPTDGGKSAKKCTTPMPLMVPPQRHMAVELMASASKSEVDGAPMSKDEIKKRKRAARKQGKRGNVAEEEVLLTEGAANSGNVAKETLRSADGGEKANKVAQKLASASAGATSSGSVAQGASQPAHGGKKPKKRKTGANEQASLAEGVTTPGNGNAVKDKPEPKRVRKTKTSTQVADSPADGASSMPLSPRFMEVVEAAKAAAELMEKAAEQQEQQTARLDINQIDGLNDLALRHLDARVVHKTATNFKNKDNELTNVCRLKVLDVHGDSILIAVWAAPTLGDKLLLHDCYRISLSGTSATNPSKYI